MFCGFVLPKSGDLVKRLIARPKGAVSTRMAIIDKRCGEDWLLSRTEKTTAI